LTVTVTTPPQFVHACSCLECQRGSGSAFSYSAFFAESAARVAGEATRWRRSSEAGRWNESNFCPTCGVTVFTRLEVLPGIVCRSEEHTSELQSLAYLVCRLLLET